MHASVRLAAVAMAIHALTAHVHAQSIDGGGEVRSTLTFAVDPTPAFLRWTITREDSGPLETLDIFQVTAQAVPPAELQETYGQIPDDEEIRRTSLTLSQAAARYVGSGVPHVQGYGGISLDAKRVRGVALGGTIVLTDWQLDVDTLSVTVDAQLQPLNADASSLQDVQLFSLSNRRVEGGVTLFDVGLSSAGIGLLQTGWGALTLGDKVIEAAAPDFGTIAVVPEPATIALTVTGLAVVGISARRRRPA